MKDFKWCKRSLFLALVLLIGLCALPLGAQSSAVMGDVNGDRIVTIVDALMVAQYYVGLTPKNFLIANADVDDNGTLTIVDALMIAQFYVGLITSFPGQTVTGMEVIQSSLARDTSVQSANSDLNSVIAGNNDFAFSSLPLLNTAAENLMFSPLSLTYAFAMAYAGAAGNTKTEMADVLNFQLPDELLHPALNTLELCITATADIPDPDFGEEFRLSLVNSTWGQRDYSFQKPYLVILALNYGAGLNVVDFIADPENCRQLINGWVSDQTENRINDLLPGGSITDLTRLVLVNAIYFKANWLFPFNANNTVIGNFTLADNSVIPVQMMNKGQVTAYYESPGVYQAVRLPYQGTNQDAMLIILPAAGQEAALENNLNSATFQQILRGLSSYYVTLSLPKFSFSWGQSMKNTLKSLGLMEAFLPYQADFSGIDGTNNLYISDVFHQSFIALDEKGTEATAATAIVIGTTSMPPQVTMSVDHPFYFIIYNEATDAILFLGRVAQP